ncbi:MAG: hypothetical protein KKH28_03190 [Elusimicrobia bacterium]|nr:hypothetical protein [Elusimicrobiota bacterium]
MSKHIEPFKKSSGDDYIEPELVNNGSGYKGRHGETQAAGDRDRYGGTARASRETNPFYAAFIKLKFVFTAAVLLVSFGLIVLGAVLTSTLIGAVIGIPLILLGVLPLWLLFKFLTFGGKNKSFIFKRF